MYVRTIVLMTSYLLYLDAQCVAISVLPAYASAESPISIAKIGIHFLMLAVFFYGSRVVPPLLLHLKGVASHVVYS